MHLKMSAKWRPFCVGLNVLRANAPLCAFIVHMQLWHNDADRTPQETCNISGMTGNPTDSVNTLMQRQNGHHFADDTFKRIFVNENVRILIEISLKFVPKGPINNIPSLVQIMAWRRQATSHYLNQWWFVYRRIYASLGLTELTHWDWVMHVCISNLTIIGSDNGLSPGRRQAIIWTNAGILLIRTLEINFS